MNFDKLVTGKEKFYFGIMLTISLFVYLILTITIIGIIYLLTFATILFIIQGITIGELKQNAVKITESQFPDIQKKIDLFSMQLGLQKVPDAYIRQSGGLLNAFATRFCFGNFIVLYSDVLEMAYENGEDAVDFIIAHELAHIKRGHLTKMKYIVCAQFIPFLNTAYSRACETTCDNIAAAFISHAPADGLLAILAGKKLYKNINKESLLKTAEANNDIWCWLAEIFSSHPNLITRIKNITKIQSQINVDAARQKEMSI